MMKRLMLLIFALALLVGMGVATTAAMAGGVDGQLWWRWSGFNNVFDADGDEDDAFASSMMRARINLGGEFEGGHYNIGIQEYFDFGAWGEDPDDWGAGVESGTADIYEANFTLTDFLFDDFDATAGRMQLAYGRERVIGTDDWDFGHEIFFDGFKGHYTMEKGWFDLLCLKLTEGEWGKYDFGFPEDDHGEFGDIDLRGIYAHIDAMPELYFEPYIMMMTMENWDAADDIDNTKMWTFGALFDYQKDGFHFYGEGTLNSGTDELEDEDISSSAFYAGLFYDFESEYKPYLGFEFNLASGQDDSEDMTEYFAPFASNSDFLGIMHSQIPMFSEAAELVCWSDIQALRFAGGFMPVEDLHIGVDYFMFSTAEERGDGTDKIGSEFDITADYMYNEDVSFEAGLGMFMIDDEIEEDLDSIMFGFLGTKVLF